MLRQRPTISKFMKDASERFFEIASSHPNALIISVVSYEPLPPHHFCRRPRNFLSDPPQDLTIEVEKLIEVNKITGAGHGMGREMALRFARLGSVVVCVDINPKGNQETVDMIKSENGKVYKFECDVTQRDAVISLGDRVRREVGDVNILVNNAGIMPCRPLLQTSEKEIRSMFDVNVMGNLWMLQAFLPAMIERNHGHIVAMSSMAGLMGIRNLVPYCGTKYAVRGIMEALLVEMKENERELDGIKFTTVCPHIVDTGLCHKPRIRFPSLLSTVAPGDAADIIVDAVRKELFEITVPRHFYYMNKVTRFGLQPPALACSRSWDLDVCGRRTRECVCLYLNFHEVQRQHQPNRNLATVFRELRARAAKQKLMREKEKAVATRRISKYFRVDKQFVQFHLITLSGHMGYLREINGRHVQFWPRVRPTVPRAPDVTPRLSNDAYPMWPWMRPATRSGTSHGLYEYDDSV
ncbi:hypothetical protein EVAR_22347_1 [Eumeta japonica]|uniref:Short-chain dehydrogenase/reductase 3 n=1 Tax=Eumeta variegata TaxID=151549 RepID=A0A4C1VHY2_EUMVA|nr:hypothetical protein EVAR_22347_1 [Eumeta japonica]